MHSSKPLQIEDFEREAQKDELYLLEKSTEVEKTELTGLEEAQLMAYDHPKATKNDTVIDADYTLPF